MGPAAHLVPKRRCPHCAVTSDEYEWQDDKCPKCSKGPDHATLPRTTYRAIIAAHERRKKNYPRE